MVPEEKDGGGKDAQGLWQDNFKIPLILLSTFLPFSRVNEKKKDREIEIKRFTSIKTFTIDTNERRRDGETETKNNGRSHADKIHVRTHKRLIITSCSVEKRRT
jgi:hypothetical protein